MSFLPDITGYISELFFRKRKVLLVEGPNDKKLFEHFFLLYQDESDETSYLESVEIDTAEYIEISSKFGNRGKVEAACVAIYENSRLREHRFAGFVDREFRRFDKDAMRDELECHQVSGLLVWSRGHSAENYLFDYSVFRQVFYDTLSIASFVEKTLPVFNKAIDNAIQIACAIGLAAYDIAQLEEVRKSIKLELFELSSTRGELQLNIDEWRCSLEKKIAPSEDKPTAQILEELVQQYKIYFENLEAADREVVRWLCDGHLGFEIILHAYCCCIRHVYNVEYCTDRQVREVEDQRLREFIKPQQIDKWIRAVRSLKDYYRCVNWWARKAKSNQCDYPTELLQLLGLT